MILAAGATAPGGSSVIAPDAQPNQLVELPRGHEFIVAKGHDIEAFKGRGGKAKL